MSIPTPPPAPGFPTDGDPAPGAPAPGAPIPGYPASELPLPYGAAAPVPPKKLNVLALVAAIVGALGFLFACIPGVLIVGWILLPIAFILSIVSLFMKGDKKWLGVVGLILSILGTIVGFVVFFAVLGTAVDNAIGSGDTTVTQPSETDDEPAAEAEESAAAAQGTRDNPYPLASAVSSDDWTIVVNTYNANGNDIVSAANQFNEPAPAGSHYEVVNYTVTYTGAESGMAMEVGLDLLTGAGNVVNSYDNFVSLGDSIGLDELYTDGTTTGSAAFLVPDGETVLIRLRPGMLADEVFVKP